MIRRATTLDIPEIEAMIAEMFAASKYAGRTKLHAKNMRELLLTLTLSQNKPGVGGSFLRVAEKDGGLVAFMAGIFQSVYFVTTALSAEDVFLYARPKAGSAVSRLVDEYIAWAAANPKVIETKLSFTDALPGAERIGQLYQRKGFNRIGCIYDRANDPIEEMAA